jgi:hypothetical protein
MFSVNGSGLMSLSKAIKFLSAFTSLAGLALATPASAMTFSLVPFGDKAKCGSNCPLVISATGDIGNETPREFYDFLTKNISDPRVRSIVFIHSPGGGVEASMRLGTMFRKTGVMAIVARVQAAPPGMGPALSVPGARCYSACVYALIGAKKRIVPKDSLVGIHRMHFDTYGRDMATGDSGAKRNFGTSAFVSQLANYANSMGVSRDLIYSAEQINPESIHIVTPQEMRKWRLGTQR